MKKRIRNSLSVILILSLLIQLMAITVKAEDYELLLKDNVSNTEAMSDSNNWGIAPEGWNTWMTVGCEAAQDVLYANGADTYASYTVKKAKIRLAKLKVVCERSLFSWSEDAMISTIKNAILASEKAGSETAVEAENITVIKTGLSDSDKKALFEAEITLPEGTTAFKIMPNASTGWAFFLTSVQLFGTSVIENEELLVDDRVSNTSLMSEQNLWGIAPEGWNTWAAVGLEQAQDVLYANGIDTYAVYTVKNAALTKARINVSVERSGYNWDEAAIKSAIRHAFSYSANGKKFTSVAEGDIKIENAGMSSDQKKQHFHITIEFPDGMKSVKIMPNCENAWIFFLTGVKLYGTRNDVEEEVISYAKAPELQIDNGGWTISGTITRQGSEEECAAEIMAGVYKAGRMLSLTKVQMSLKKGENTFKLTAPAQSDITDTTIMLYLWDSEDGMTPFITVPQVFEVVK